MSPSSGSGLVKLAFVVILVVQAIVWSQGRYVSSQSFVSNSLLGVVKRGVGNAEQCAPLSVPIEDQCAHVRQACPTATTVLSIPYLQHYFCAAPSVRPLVFSGLLLWLVFLFSTLGISASDFFCPNLATLAERLGLDENVAGVTFLAFGNGSPDVFSTFSAMRAGAGALAVGELLGAASFIVSVVAGTMCIIRPFSVNARPFMRDVGFFTVAVALLLIILWDGHIHAWEAATLVGLYVIYVLVVVIGSWWDRRQLRRKQLEDIVRGEYAEELPEPYRDDPSFEHLAVPSSSPRMRAYSSPATPPSLGIDTTHFRPRSASRSHTPSPSHTPRLSQMPSFSLVGALEFRQVVASLQHQSAGAALSAFESPVTPYVGGHYHSHHGSLSRPISRRPSSAYSQHSAVSQDAWDDALPLHARSPRSQALALPEDGASAFSSLSPPLGIPRIETTPASPSSETSTDADGLGLLGFGSANSSSHTHPLSYPRTRPQRIAHAVRHTLHVLFPTLHGFREKSVAGKLASVLAAPAVLALTVTLPVHVTPRGSAGEGEKEGVQVGSTVPEARLVDFEEEGVERVLTAEEDVQEEMHELKFNKWLMAVQMVFGPLFCVAVLFCGMQRNREVWLLAATAIAGSTAAAFVLVFAGRGTNSVAQMARCSMGFFVAVVWIMAIADEVVNVLKTFGFIFGLSDAIIGLTVFAVGNSLADFVANVSVAAFAPVMGFSACFGGPMLNILLGVGVSGTAVIRSAGGVPFEVDFSATLLVSTVGLLALLLATLVGVPLNNYHLTRRWGVFLVVSYIIIMVINIAVEVKR
ncbi:Sodium/calcium exchanger protein-domain-containing protein [Phellopilus nigrolimitatus]|nr:Sodium/calcium exchanger protein-domain-containing protein [Phellopilus nigrolimitatus]